MNISKTLWIVTLLFFSSCLYIINAVFFSYTVETQILLFLNQLYDPFLFTIGLVIATALSTFYPSILITLIETLQDKFSLEYQWLVLWLGLTQGGILIYCFGRYFQRIKQIRDKSTSILQIRGHKTILISIICLRFIPFIGEVLLLISGVIRLPFYQYLLLTSTIHISYSYSLIYLTGIYSWQINYLLYLLFALFIPIIVVMVAIYCCHLIKQLMNKIRQPELITTHAKVFIQFDSLQLDSPYFAHHLQEYAPKNYNNIIILIDQHYSERCIASDHQVAIRNYCKKYQINLIDYQECDHNKTTEINSWHDCPQLTVIIIGNGEFIGYFYEQLLAFDRNIFQIHVPIDLVTLCHYPYLPNTQVKYFHSIYDMSLLQSYSKEEYKISVLIALKVGIIGSTDMLQWVEDEIEKIKQFNELVLYQLVKKCARFHQGSEDIQTHWLVDEKYLPWSAESLQDLSGQQLNDSEAMAIALGLSVEYATYKGMITKAYGVRIRYILRALGFSLWHPSLSNKGNFNYVTQPTSIESK